MMLKSFSSLPVDAVLPELLGLLEEQNAVLVAPPGAGKTTRVPLALLAAQQSGQRILVLEPRRLAARSTAEYMAELLGEKVGQTVGYRMRRDRKVGPATRIEVITEGILTRMLQQDAALGDVGIVIFDEFHERSIHADLGLALCLESQAVLREDLKILVMSATLEAEPVAALLGNCPIVVSRGRSFSVETIYLEQSCRDMEAAVVETVCQALTKQNGDVLVFLPGVGEIRRVKQKLESKIDGLAVRIAELYGNLPQKLQSEAIRPAKYRKVILATAIAETSLTVEGVRTVIDSGLMRVSRFSPRTAMSRLETVRVSLSSADQRRGRAGRLGPGVCYRLWTKQEQIRLAPRGNPEILESDLTFLVLELALWGIKEASKLSWLDLPPQAAFDKGKELLISLGALQADGTITEHGKNLSAAGIHPRLAHMILAAKPLDLGQQACELAAVLNERELLTGSEAKNPDIRIRLGALQSGGNDLNAAVARRIALEVQQLQVLFKVTSSRAKPQYSCGLLIAFAYPDRIAQRRSDGRFLMRNGRGAFWPGESNLDEFPYLAVAELDDTGVDSRILSAAPLRENEVELCCKQEIQEKIVVFWNENVKAVQARKQQRLDAIILKESFIAEPAGDAVLQALLEGITKQGLACLPWTKNARQFRQRMQFMNEHCPEEWPDVSDQALLLTLESWLGPYLAGMTSQIELDKLQLQPILAALLEWQQLQILEEYAPAQMLVPSGQRIAIDYSEPKSPVLAVKLQEVFGLAETPCIYQGKIPLTLHLLSPARRPVQVTQDLANFWHTTYYEVKKELQGRYPKHYWPSDPIAATPTHRVRPQLS